ncbi:glycosyltransferase family 2 protein [Shimia sp. SDUM112013]|uniref:glycosyltransferase family 2 protein n=1 Tax=Shimia sp. SDUM112013 TaxID=3136160 RepID=UPI0032EE42CB
MPSTDFHRRIIKHQKLGDGIVLAAVRRPDGTAQSYFAVGTSADQIKPARDTQITMIRSVGDGMIVTTEGEDPPCLSVGEDSATVDLLDNEQDLFAGLNAFLAIRNGESAEATLEWLTYHVETQGLEAVLILDRTAPDSDETYAKVLKKGLKSIEGLKCLVHVQLDYPLGHPDLPSEAHPFNAPDAPGKDRMEVPKGAPWESPQRELQLFEWARHQYLDRARAVALLDISDLVMPRDGVGSVFDFAVQSRTGSVVLAGRHCYPWRSRNGADARFADHICVQFDATKLRRRWCVAPEKAGPDSVWRLVRIVGTKPGAKEWVPFFRFMGLRHPTDSVSSIVPKTSLVEEEALLALSKVRFTYKPVRMPVLERPKVDPNSNRTCIITCMKNEGPFILEWVAYHRAIGVEDFIVYTNDCTDGTDDFLDLLQAKGILQHRDNPFKGTGLKPQHAALQAGEKEEIVQNADWVISMDVDEFINIKTGKGCLPDLFKAVGDANMISCTWRLFGNSDIHEYVDEPLIAQYDKCAREMTRKPHQAWGFKTLFRNIGLFKKLGVHRPKGLNPQLWDEIRWVNGSGKPLPKDMYRNAWRSTSDTVGYDLVQLNHYAVRSAESFLVKRDRGRVNHVDRDQGLAYWFRMNNNSVTDTSIQRMIPLLQAEMDHLLADPEIAEAHHFCVDKHRGKIDALKATPNYAKFYQDLTGPRMEQLSKLHHIFGANVFLAGPDVIPDEIVRDDHPEGFFFTVEKQDTAH